MSLLAALSVPVVGWAAGTPVVTPTATTPLSPWKVSASAAVKETFDSNVYLQSVSPLADQASLVTTVMPQVGGSWSPSPLFSATLGYTPEIAFFHAEPSEDYAAHRVALGMAGQADGLAYDLANSLLVIDGNGEGPTWTGPGGAPAAGGIAVRDRRDATVIRSGLKVTQTLGEWRIRAAGTFYLHDFQTRHSAAKGYQNYVDRNELTGGLDVGHRIPANATAWLGYRYGVQDQSRLLAFPEEYDSTFHRVLVGLEGSLTRWLKLGISLGPEFRTYDDGVPASFGDRDRLNLYVDATATATLSSADTLTLSHKQLEQPGFSGRATYQDTTTDLAWRHKLSPRWTVGIGGRAYNTDFLRPSLRNDWILSANGVVNCAITKALSAELSYAFEDGLSQVPGTEGREFERHLASLGLKYVFR